MTAFDHLLALLLVVIWPVIGTRAYHRFVRAIENGEAGARARQYRSTILEEWALVAATVGLWIVLRREPAALGLTLGPPGRWVVGLAITMIMLGLLLAQWRALRVLTPARKARIRAQLAGAGPFLPVTDAEYRLFRVLAVTAGITEEILFRGFLIWYAGNFVGPWVGAVVAAICFGLGHAYQGRAGMVRTGLVGLFMGFFYLAAGSLLGPMIVHAAIDLQGGAVGRAALAEPMTGPGSEAPSPDPGVPVEP